ncbi:hypothetical protein PINS_up009322 [Pythium insidiosum]|nr:hypothetical protein PINS_up009322 [Pythium insidiosum]
MASTSSLTLSRRGLSSLAQIPSDVVERMERDHGSTRGYALSLAQNRLTRVDDVYIFRHVVQLDLSGNMLRSLDGIEALASLQRLDVSQNALTSLDAIAALPQLRELHVAENDLLQLDPVAALQRLEILDASCNNIAVWPQLSHITTLTSIDLSRNLLEAPPANLVRRLFPPDLRHLALTKNQIHELCGIVCLGSRLQRLESLTLDGNPVVQRVLRDGGSLGFLVNLFPSANVTCFTGGDAGLKLPIQQQREDFVVPDDVVRAVEEAAQQGNEELLTTFLLTGAAPAMSVVHKPAANYARLDEHVKVNEILAPAPSMPDTNSQEPRAGLSKQGKMELWKKMMEERKAREIQERERLQREKLENSSPSILRDTVGEASLEHTLPPPAQPQQVISRREQFSPVAPPPPPLQATSAISRPVREPRADTTQSVARLKPSPPLPDVPSASTDALVNHVRALHDQLSSMRKYMNVWIRREQMAREAAARRLQRWFCRRMLRKRLETRIQCSRRRRELEYSVQHACAKPYRPRRGESRFATDVHAVQIQRHVRGWLMRTRISRWMWYDGAARSLQRMWRRRRTDRRLSEASNQNAVVRQLREDVCQLQRVCVVQEHLIRQLWDEMTRYRGFLELRRYRAIVRLQVLVLEILEVILQLIGLNDLLSAGERLALVYIYITLMLLNVISCFVFFTIAWKATNHFTETIVDAM